MEEIDPTMLDTLRQLAAAGNIDLTTLLQNEKPTIPTVDVSEQAHIVADKLGKILADKGLFQHAGKFVVINEDDPKNLTDDIDSDVFVTYINQYAVIHKGYSKNSEGKKIPKKCNLTTTLSNLILKSQNFRRLIPKINSILPAQIPILDSDGNPQLLKKGYNPEQQTYILKNSPDIETDWPIEKAFETYFDTFGTFPWGDEGRSMAAHVSAMIGMFCQLFFPEASLVPLYQFTANLEGSGKSILARTVLYPIYGITASSTDYNLTDKFTENLNSIANSGKAYLFLDDLKGTIINQTLNRWVTEPSWTFRKFREQSMITVSKRAMTLITDNGSVLSDDLIRRAIIIHLEAKERAADRKISLKKEINEEWLTATKNRSTILSMLWSFVRTWAEEGKKESSRTIPSFTGWSNIVGGIVENAGFSAPFEDANLLTGGDIRRTEFNLLLKEVVTRFKPTEGDPKQVPLIELCAIARELGIFEHPLKTNDIIRVEMDHNPGRFYKEITVQEGGEPEETRLPRTEEEKNAQSYRYMDPHKHASPFAKRLKKNLGMKFTVDGHQYRWGDKQKRHSTFEVTYLN